jgi:transcriptional regulator with XRE-family HTH domain
MDIGLAIRKFREQAKLSQEELAYYAKRSRNYISLMELNRKSPTLETLSDLCRVFKVPASELIREAESHPLPPKKPKKLKQPKK